MKKNKLLAFVLALVVLIGGISTLKGYNDYSCNNEDEGWSSIIQFLA